MRLRALRNTKGQALVEIALVLPVVLLLILGTLEVGRIIHTSLVVNHAAREGARAGALEAEDSEIVSKVSQALVAVDNGQTEIFIQPSEANRKPGQSVTVEVRFPVTMYTPLIGKLLSNPFIVKSEVTMRVE